MNINNPAKASPTKPLLTPYLQKKNIVPAKDLDSYYNDLNSLTVGNKRDTHVTELIGTTKDIPSVKCNIDSVGKNAINFNLPFITQNVFEQNVKDCYTHGRNDSTNSRVRSDSTEIPQNTAMNVLPNIGIYNYSNNSWNLPKTADSRLSVDKSTAPYRLPDQTTKATYTLNQPDANKFNNLAGSKDTVSQDLIQHRANVSENTTYSNSNKPDSKQIKSQEHLQNSTKTLYDFNLSEPMTYSDRNKSNMAFGADKYTIPVSNQSIPNSSKYSLNTSETSGNKVRFFSSGLQNSKKATYGFDVPDPTTYMYPNSTYNSRSSSNVSESYALQNMPVTSKPAIAPSTEYRSADFGMPPTNVPLGFGSNHYDKLASSLCSAKSTTATEAFALNSYSDSKKFPESFDSRLQSSALQSEINSRIIAADNIHCANIFDDKNVTSKISGMRANTLQYPLKSNEFGPNQLYSNYQHVAEFQSKSDNPARMPNVIYPERLSNTRLPNSNIQQNSQAYTDKGCSKDEKQVSVGTLNQDIFGKKHNKLGTSQIYEKSMENQRIMQMT
nr:unnamed protein product [Callosobruchus chinensis]